MRLFFLWALVCLGFAFAGASAIAEHKPVSAKSSSVSKAAPEAPQAEQQPNIDPVVLAMLIKSTIMALQHANQTGNYSVLRDLGTPLFRERLDQARLTAVFSNLRSRGINLSPVLMLAPNLKQAELTGQNRLHLAGNFPTQPLQVQYELVFLMIGGVWRIEDISVDAVPPQPVADASRAQTADPSGGQTAQAVSTAVKSSKLPANPKN
jgi:hypothetical protein